MQGLISEFKEDYVIMAEHLKIMNKRMVLLNPVSSFKILKLYKHSIYTKLFLNFVNDLYLCVCI